MFKTVLISTLAALALAAPASAAKIQGDEAARWQASADASLEPTPPDWAAITVHEAAPPPDANARGWYDGYSNIYLNPATGGVDERVFRHELGHAAWTWVLVLPEERARFHDFVPQSTNDPEWFAETYGDCMISLDTPRDGEHAYGWNMTLDQYRSVCAWIKTYDAPRLPGSSPDVNPTGDLAPDTLGATPPAPDTAVQPSSHAPRYRTVKRCKRRIVRYKHGRKKGRAVRRHGHWVRHHGHQRWKPGKIVRHKHCKKVRIRVR